MANHPVNLDSVFLLFPNMFGFKGGVQVYSAHLLKALQSLYPSAKQSVFLKYDRPHHVQAASTTAAAPQTQFHCFGQLARPLQTLMLGAEVINLGVQQPPSLMICSHINYGIVGYGLKRLRGVPYWVVAHGLESWDLRDRLTIAALQYADRVVAVSHYTRDRLLQEQQLDPDRVVVLPNTFEPEAFQVAPKPTDLLARYGLTADQPVILTVTRLGQSASYKGYDKIIQALPQIRQQIPNVHYVLVGKGDDRPRIEAMIDHLDLRDCVTLTGFVADEELADHYNLCDVFAMPSLGEGFGIVYLEALACGKPVLAGNRDGAVDPLARGALGCLVDPDDGAAIAHNLTQILQGTYPNPVLYQPAALRQRIIDAYAIPQFRQQLNHLLEQQFAVSQNPMSLPHLAV